jgi:hypothetical protein
MAPATNHPIARTPGEDGQHDARGGALECRRTPRRQQAQARPQERSGDTEPAGAIRRLVDTRPTSGYGRIAALPGAALAFVDSWMEDYNTVHPHSRLGYQSPREYIAFFPNRRVSGLTISGRHNDVRLSS